MTLRDDLIPVFDNTRTLIDDLGLRTRKPVTVVTRTRATTGLDSLAATHPTSVLTLTPPPRVREMTRYQAGESGRYQAGDLKVDRISGTYTEAQLNPGGDSWWTIAGDEYALVSLVPVFSGWEAVVRRRRT